MKCEQFILSFWPISFWGRGEYSYKKVKCLRDPHCWDPEILDGRTWSELEEHGEYGEHGKDGKHQPDD